MQKHININIHTYIYIYLNVCSTGIYYNNVTEVIIIFYVQKNFTHNIFYKH